MQSPSTAPSRAPTFPPEIIDNITDFLFDDKSTLANVSLVSRAFLPSARLHLFETLRIETNQFWVLTELGVQVSEIMDILTPFASLVRHLRLHNNEKDVMLREWIGFFLPCLSLFNGVMTLSLPNFGWDRRGEVKNELFSCFSGIRELIIVEGWFSAIIWSALQFPLLEQLHLDQISSEYYSSVPNDAQAFSNLHSLTISGSVSEPTLCLFSSLERIPSLHTLQITLLVPNYLESTGQLIRALAPTLKHLRLEFSSWGSGEVHPHQSTS
jgi:hypothetical protein